MSAPDPPLSAPRRGGRGSAAGTGACLGTFLAVALLLGAGCSTPRPPRFEWLTYHAPGDRMSTPPPGQALVNFHRPPPCVYPQFTFAVFSEAGRFLADVPGEGQVQVVCDPAQNVFIGWLGNNPISVVKAELAPGKVYDIRVLEGANDRPRFVPLRKDDSLRARLPEWEAAENLVSLRDLPRVANSQARVQPKIAQIRTDFLGGSKSNRVLILESSDCR